MPEAKRQNLIVRMTPEEKARLRDIAEKHKLNVSDYARAVLFKNSELTEAAKKEASHQLDIFLHVLNRKDTAKISKKE